MENYAYVYRFLFSTCGNNANLAEELTQDTFFEAYRSLHKYSGKSQIKTWLCGIGKNVWFHYIRKHKNVIENLDALEETLFEDSGLSPDNRLESKERAKLLTKAFMKLKSTYREVLWLKCTTNFTFAKISQIMGITENSAKVIYFRAKNKLKEELTNEGFF